MQQHIYFLYYIFIPFCICIEKIHDGNKIIIRVNDTYSNVNI